MSLFARFTAANCLRNSASSANGIKFFQLTQILDPALPMCEEINSARAWIGLIQPTPGCNTVGHVDDFAGIETVKIGKDGLLHQFVYEFAATPFTL